jgi:hypothetical protein
VRIALVLAILTTACAHAQTNSLQGCEATLRAYRAEFEGLIYSGMTPVAGHPTTLIRTAPASEFSLSYLIVAHDAVLECSRQQLVAGRPLSEDLKSVSNSVDAMLARRLLNYVVKHPERAREIDESTPAVQTSK